jgi:hypothetical protein
MKKIMSLMLGLSIMLGGVAFAADEKPAAGEKAATETKKKKKKNVGKKVEEKPAEAKK